MECLHQERVEGFINHKTGLTIIICRDCRVKIFDSAKGIDLIK